MSEMLDFLKAISSPDRLRIIGLLTRARASRAEIVSQLGLPLREVVNHLAFLEHVGVLTHKEDGYELDSYNLAALARDQLGREHASYIPAPELEGSARSVLRAYLNKNGSLKQIPSQPAKLQVVLNYLIDAFIPATDYSEKEVNVILRRFNEDTAGLRRYLVDAGLLSRESDGSRYWRTV